MNAPALEAAETIVDDEAIPRTMLQIRSPILGERLAGVSEGLLQLLKAPGQDCRDCLVKKVEAAAKLDDGTKHSRSAPAPAALLLCPTESPLGRVFPEVDAVAQPIPIVGAWLPVPDGLRPKQEVAREVFRAPVKADDDPGKLVHTGHAPMACNEPGKKETGSTAQMSLTG
jgi:hypothetical protein